MFPRRPSVRYRTTGLDQVEGDDRVGVVCVRRTGVSRPDSEHVATLLEVVAGSVPGLGRGAAVGPERDPPVAEEDPELVLRQRAQHRAGSKGDDAALDLW